MIILIALIIIVVIAFLLFRRYLKGIYDFTYESRRIQIGLAILPALTIVIFYSSILYFYLKFGHIPSRSTNPPYYNGILFSYIRIIESVLMLLSYFSIIIWFFVVIISLIKYRTFKVLSWLGLLSIAFSIIGRFIIGIRYEFYLYNDWFF